VHVSKLQRELGEEHGLWLANMAIGQDGEVVKPRLAPKSIGCGKSFLAHLQITSMETVSLQFFLVACAAGSAAPPLHSPQ
jgi:hypothetical protein